MSMANNESPLFRDIFFSSTAVMLDTNEDSLLQTDFTVTDGGFILNCTDNVCV
jgi:hypothetical protein